VAYQNQYEFGDAFMIAPFESGRDYGKVYFPAGTWYNLYNGEVQQGNQEKIIPLKINELPVFIKGSSIIPMQSLIQTTAEKPTDTLTVHIYNGENANKFTYYEDDGKSFSYQKGDYYKRTISFDPKKSSLTFSAVEGTYKSNFKYIKLVFHGFDQVTSVRSNNGQLKLEQGQFAFLGAAANTDPQISAYPVENCPVKLITINNAQDSIQLIFNKGK
jgi:alpha-glucosidase